MTARQWSQFFDHGPLTINPSPLSVFHHSLISLSARQTVSSLWSVFFFFFLFSPLLTVFLSVMLGVKYADSQHDRDVNTPECTSVSRGRRASLCLIDRW